MQGRKCGVDATFSASLLISSGSERKNALRDAPSPFLFCALPVPREFQEFTREVCKHPRPSRRLHSKTHHKKTHPKTHHKNVLSTRNSQKYASLGICCSPGREGSLGTLCPSWCHKSLCRFVMCFRVVMCVHEWSAWPRGKIEKDRCDIRLSLPRIPCAACTLLVNFEFTCTRTAEPRRYGFTPVSRTPVQTKIFALSKQQGEIGADTGQRFCFVAAQHKRGCLRFRK